MIDKTKKVLLTIAMLVLLTSCGSNKDFDRSMQKKKEANKERKFEQAEGYDEQAKESKPKDTEAKQYQAQIKLFVSAESDMKNQDYDKAVKKLDAVIDIKNGSSKLIEYAKKDKKEIIAKKQASKTEEIKGKQDNAEKESQEISIWNKEKSDSLRGFMNKFSHTMGQNYKEYSKESNVDLYGVSLPKDILNGEWKMAINNQPVQVEWSDSGTGKTPYQLVAVY